MNGSIYTKLKQKSAALLLIFLLISSQACVFAAKAEASQVRLEMDDTNIAMGASVTLSLVLSNIDQTAKIVDFEGIDNFDVKSSGQSSSTSIVNGTTTKEIRYNQTIMPRNEGTFQLKAILEIDGKNYETNELTVVVAPQDESLKEVDEDIFLKTSVSKEQIYFGERTVVTYQLYSRYQIEQAGFTEDTLCDDFIVEENTNLDTGSSYIDIGGKRYVKIKSKQLVLSPMETGTLKIPAFEYQANVGSGSFFGQTKPVYLKSDEVSIEVLPLPSEGKPTNFQGLTGDIELDYSYSSDRGEVNEPITLDLTLKGQGNINMIDSIAELMDLSAFSVYETADDTVKNIKTNGYFMEKHFEIILIPKRAENLVIPKLEIPYFNVEKQSYDTLSIDEKTIKIDGGDTEKDNSSSAAQSESYMNTDPVRIDQVTYEATDSEYFVIKLPKRTVYMSLIVLVAVLIAIGGGVHYFKRRKRHNAFEKALKKASSEKELHDLLAVYINEKYNIQIKSMTAEVVAVTLENSDLSVDQIQDIIELIHDFEDRRFRETIPFETLKEKMKLIIQKV